MAKIYGIAGAVRGRAGNNVFSKGMDGRTIVRAYQPTVFNPNSLPQRRQRAKVNLVGQLSGVCSREVLSPLGFGSARKNRAMFLRDNILGTSVSVANNDVTAMLPFAQIVFSRGQETWASRLGVFTGARANQTSISVDLSGDIDRFSDMLEDGAHGMRFIAIVASSLMAAGQSSVSYKSVSFTDKMFVGGGASRDNDVTISLPAPLTADDVVAVYECPFVLTEEGRRVYAEGMTGNNGDARLEAMLLTSLSQQKKWGVSSFLKSNVVQPVTSVVPNDGNRSVEPKTEKGKTK